MTKAPSTPSNSRGAFLSQNIFSYIHTKLAARISHGYRDRHQCLMQARTLARCPRKQKTRPMISKNIMDRVRLFLFYSILSLAPGFPAASGNPDSILSINSILLLLFYHFYTISPASPSPPTDTGRRDERSCGPGGSPGC
mgnify:FL=1